MPREKECEKKKTDDDAIPAEHPEAMFYEEGNKSFDSQYGDDECNDIPQDDHVNIVMAEEFRVMPPGVP